MEEKIYKEMYKTFQERFEALKEALKLPNMRLLAVQLDGFTHGVIVDTGENTDIQRMGYSGYFRYYSDRATPETINPQGITYAEADKAMAEFFKGYPHVAFKGQAVELVFISPDERNGGEAHEE